MARNRTTDLKNALQWSDWERDRLIAQGAEYFKVTGEVEVNGVGEAVVSVVFPVLFVDKPKISHGAELGPGQPVTVTQVPTTSVVVIRYDERVRDDGTVIFAGATLGLVTSGSAGQVFNVQWHAEGIALRGPVPDGQ